MNKKLSLIIALQAFIIILMFWVIVFYGKDEYEAYRHEQEEEIESPNRVSIEDGITSITVTTESQQQSGISTATLSSSQHTSTLPALGQVLSLDPLIELRTRYLAATAEASIAKASLLNTEQEYKRLKELNDDDKNVSDRAVMVAEASWRSDQAKLLAAESTEKALRDNIRQSWGDTLATWLTSQNNNPEAQGLLQHSQVLVRVTLPFDSSTPKTGESIKIRPTGTNSGYHTARLISAAPQSDNLAQGKTYYYQASADELRAGMRVNILREKSDIKSTTGIMIPAQAVIWYGGKAWVYKKLDQDKFTRIPVNTSLATEDGWFDNSSHLTSKDQIVISGAQLLLSEEFKYQIKNENED